jgi:hypothetical protein
MALGDIIWAVDEQTLVTLLDIDPDHVMALVLRIGHPATQGGGPVAFLLSTNAEQRILIDGLDVDLGDRMIDFLNILEEAGAVGIPGVAYLSDPFAD